MDIIWALGLIIFLFVGLNHMAGGRAFNILNPVLRLTTRLLRYLIGVATSLVGSVLKLGVSSFLLPGRTKNRKDNTKRIEPPARPWKKKDMEK